jgi:hypothetical protein
MKRNAEKQRDIFGQSLEGLVWSLPGIKYGPLMTNILFIRNEKTFVSPYLSVH